MAAERRAPSKGFGFLFEMGCGKTLTAIATMGALYEAGKIQRCLVVAPTTVVPVWPKEMAEMADFPFVSCTMLGGDKRRRIRQYREMMQRSAGSSALKLVCINYQEIFREGIIDLLKEYHADLVILDEGHYIKNHTASTSKAACELGQMARYRLLLTGTPVTNNNTDVFGLFKFVNSNVFGDNFYSFRNKYCVMGGFKGKQVMGSKNKGELVRRMHSASLRVTKADALDLPEETYETRYVELSKAEREVYTQLQKNGLAELADGEITAPRIITKMLRLQQVAGGFVKLDEEEGVKPIGRSKLDALMEIVDQVVVDSGEKLVIFARFLPEVHSICRELEGRGVKYAVIYGDIKQETRGEIVNDFQKNPETKVFVAQIATAGLGITLHAASTAVFYSMDFSFANYAQATARIHRIGQRHPCLYINLVAMDTIDEQILKAIRAKEDLSVSICDDWRRFFGKEKQ